MLQSKIRVGVLFGGESGEHEVSLLSAKSIMENLDPHQYEIIPIGITKNGKWIVGNQAFKALGTDIPPKLIDNHTLEDAQTPIHLTSSTIPALNPESIDVVIPVLHGPFGEDGTVQGMLELLHIPYVGCGVLGSAVSMDKIMMKSVFAKAGVDQCDYLALTRYRIETERESVISEIEQQLGYPCFVKPANLGSSVGISKAKNRDELIAALQVATTYDRRIIVEENINAREIEVAVLGNEQPRASLPGEVIPGAEFYDYSDKYLTGRTSYQIPADLPEYLQNEIRATAIKAFQAVDGAGLSRVDFFLEKETNRILINEINTFPGFTIYSMYPKLWEVTGLSYSDLLVELIRLALERHQEG